MSFILGGSADLQSTALGLPWPKRFYSTISLLQTCSFQSWMRRGAITHLGYEESRSLPGGPAGKRCPGSLSHAASLQCAWLWETGPMKAWKFDCTLFIYLCSVNFFCWSLPLPASLCGCTNICTGKQRGESLGARNMQPGQSGEWRLFELASAMLLVSV